MRVSDRVIEIVQDLERRHQGTDLSINGRTLTGVLRDIAKRVRVEEDARPSLRAALNGVCGMLGLTERDGLPDMPEVIRTELERRLMPEGMEWPRFEDGEPVCIGSEILTTDGQVRCEHFALTITDDDGGVTTIDFGERVKRPAPKVLDADGVEICVGDVLYSIKTGDSVTVDSIEPSNPWFVTTDGALQHCAKFTHRAPVLAADGKPLREGETVYLTDSPTAFVVDDIMTREDGATVVHLKDVAWHRPRDLTHERPDTWERLEEDASLDPFDYCVGRGVADMGAGHLEDARVMARDLVRRAKKLAGRDAK